ncbi:hypothetical protein CRM86_14200 [Pseudomonas putida]|nr:hypothetical protein CRM86_14200 [Pseudomonas putida]
MLANFHLSFTIAAATVFAGKPRLHTYRRVTGRCVGAGSPAKGPALLANFHPTFTVAAATVFAGKPAPTHVSVVGERPS